MDLGVTGPVYLTSMVLTMILSLIVLLEQVAEPGMSLSPGSDLTTSVSLYGPLWLGGLPRASLPPSPS